ncbi:C-type lectin domain family 4 member M-like [Haliotis rubra]|uniref:C-type lectin domain family 4 member M-like n=1 Tax=Haliotis rubra TaxID=36100 RepID=UPI001EE52E0B|nr:C-type lectin domain family 4 member M-like [Haliotis rubra]XP_046560221.1 C-type lectin domain family 4 member M-like [Haliotis rubra]
MATGLLLSVVLSDVLDNSLNIAVTNSIFNCAIRCYSSGCSSFFYNKATHQCAISPHTYRHGNIVLASNTGMKLYSWNLDGCSLSDGWIYHPPSNLCYKRSDYKVNSTMAQTLCRDAGARLVVVDTAEKNDHLLTLHLTPDQKSWIGLRKVSGTWKWSNGETLGPFTAWKSTHPENGKECGVLTGYLQGWSSFNCLTDHDVNYICDKEMKDDVMNLCV